MAVVAEGERQRVYLPPDAEHEKAANVLRPDGAPATDLPQQALGFRVQGYGQTQHADLFTNRQLTALCACSNLVSAAKEHLLDVGRSSGYVDAVATYLTFFDRQTG